MPPEQAAVVSKNVARTASTQQDISTPDHPLCASDFPEMEPQHLSNQKMQLNHAQPDLQILSKEVSGARDGKFWGGFLMQQQTTESRRESSGMREKACVRPVDQVQAFDILLTFFWKRCLLSVCPYSSHAHRSACFRNSRIEP